MVTPRPPIKFHSSQGSISVYVILDLMQAIFPDTKIIWFSKPWGLKMLVYNNPNIVCSSHNLLFCLVNPEFLNSSLPSNYLGAPNKHVDIWVPASEILF